MWRPLVKMNPTQKEKETSFLDVVVAAALFIFWFFFCPVWKRCQVANVSCRFIASDRNEQGNMANGEKEKPETNSRMQ